MKRDTFELIQALEGYIEPYAETHVDEKHLANLKEWCELHERITDEIAKVANTSSLRCYYSSKEIIDYAREHLRNIDQYLGDYINNWNYDELSEETDEENCF
jgi:hypothetical protein